MAESFLLVAQQVLMLYLIMAVGFVLGVGRVLTGFLFMSVALLLASLVMRAFPALRQSAAKKQPLVPYFAVAFIPAYFL